MRARRPADRAAWADLGFRLVLLALVTLWIVVPPARPAPEAPRPHLAAEAPP